MVGAGVSESHKMTIDTEKKVVNRGSKLMEGIK